MILEIICVIFLIEALTNLLTKSEIFRPVRAYLFKNNNVILKFIHNILDCPYCTSVWVSFFSVMMLYLYIKGILPYILTLFFISIVLHRISNLLHFIIDRIDPNHIGLDMENK